MTSFGYAIKPHLNDGDKASQQKIGGKKVGWEFQTKGLKPRGTNLKLLYHEIKIRRIRIKKIRLCKTTQAYLENNILSEKKFQRSKFDDITQANGRLVFPTDRSFFYAAFNRAIRDPCSFSSA